MCISYKYRYISEWSNYEAFTLLRPLHQLRPRPRPHRLSVSKEAVSLKPLLLLGFDHCHGFVVLWRFAAQAVEMLFVQLLRALLSQSSHALLVAQ